MFLIIILIVWIIDSKSVYNRHNNCEICLWEDENEALMVIFGYLISAIAIIVLLILSCLFRFSSSSLPVIFFMLCASFTAWFYIKSYENNKDILTVLEVFFTKVFISLMVLCFSVLVLLFVLCAKGNKDE